MTDDRLQFGGIGHIGVEAVGRSVQRGVNRRCHGPLGGLEVGIAGADREAIRLADRGHRDDPDREGEVANQLAHQDQLLKVLLAEIGALRLGQQEELEHDREHAGEVPRPALALADDPEQRLVVVRSLAQEIGERIDEKADALRLAAEADWNSGKLAEAKAAFVAALAANARNTRARAELGVLYRGTDKTAYRA